MFKFRKSSFYDKKLVPKYDKKLNTEPKLQTL